MHRRLAIAALVVAVALSVPGIAFAKWTLSGSGAASSAATTLVAPTGVTPTSNVNSSGNADTGNHDCVPSTHLAYEKVSWTAPTTTFAGETYTISWTLQSGTGTSSSASGFTGSPQVVQVASANSNSPSYKFTVTSSLGDKWTAASTASSTTSVHAC